jgi:hypothetical protein
MLGNPNHEQLPTPMALMLLSVPSLIKGLDPIAIQFAMVAPSKESTYKKVTVSKYGGGVVTIDPTSASNSDAINKNASRTCFHNHLQPFLSL